MTLIFAIETIEKYGSVALLDGDRILSESRLPHDRRSAQALFPAMRTIFRETNIEPQDVYVIAAVIGPGSFTGLRVGITAAKLFAYSVGAKIIPVNTFETVAAGMLELENPPKYLTAGVDAQRDEIVRQDYFLHKDEKRYEAIRNEHYAGGFELLPFEKWQPRDWADLCFTGPALEKYAAKLPPEVNAAAQEFWFPKASVAGQLANSLLEKQERQTVNAFELLPVYSRLSAAEERLKKDVNSM